MESKYKNFIKRWIQMEEFYSKGSPYMSGKDFDYLCYDLKIGGIQRESISGADL